MPDTRSNTLERRAAIERELQERLSRANVRRQPADGPPTPASIGQVALACAACRGISPADARFCTRCGVRFNAAVVAHGAQALASAMVAIVMLLNPPASAATPQTPAMPQAAPPPLLSTTPVPAAGANAQPAQMSGLPLQVSDLPPGTVAVRVIRRSFAENVPGQRVDLAVGAEGRVLSATTDAAGRALFHDLKIGEMMRARATVDGEPLASQFFELPAQGGVRLVLVAGAGAGSGTPALHAGDPPPVASSSGAAAGSLRRTVVIAITGSLLALAAGAVGVSASRNRRRPQPHATAEARGDRPQPGRREALFQALVRLEREHHVGKVADADYATRRDALIDELVEIDSATL